MNHRVRRVDAETGVITTVAGMGQPRSSGDGGLAVEAGLNEPAALAVSDAGCPLYCRPEQQPCAGGRFGHWQRFVRSQGLERLPIMEMDVAAKETGLSGPSGLALASDGTLYHRRYLQWKRFVPSIRHWYHTNCGGRRR